MSSFVTVNAEDLDTGAELTQEEVEENDANCETKESSRVNFSFRNALSNLFSGGGRTRRQKIAGSTIDNVHLIGLLMKALMLGWEHHRIYHWTIFYCICLLADGEIDPPDNPTVSGGNLCDQDFYELRASCLESGELFVDPEFPPDDQSLYFSQDPPFAVEWKRASEISDDPRLFEGGASRFDINQVENSLFGTALDAVAFEVIK